MMKSFNFKKLIFNHSNKQNNYYFIKLQQKNFKYTVGLDPSEIDTSDKVTIYTAPEHKEIFDYLNSQNYFKIIPKGNSVQTLTNIWKNCIENSKDFKKKYYGLMPLIFDDKFSLRAKKKFILEMNLLPKVKYVEFIACLSSGIVKFISPLEDIIPITADDFKLRHHVIKSLPADFVDIDMIYTNYKTMDMFCFDKQGTWHSDGVNHELLNVNNSLKENRWFDYLKSDTFWH